MTEKAKHLYEAIVAMAMVNENTMIVKYLNQLLSELEVETDKETPELIDGVMDALNDLNIR